jgi:hypothetical protein
MKKLVCVLATAMLVALAVPASAQVGVGIGDNGVSVRLGDRDHHRDRFVDRDRDELRYRDRDDYRDHDWRGRHRGRECDTFWRHDHRVTVCHGG